jgi:hypothetical protein
MSAMTEGIKYAGPDGGKFSELRAPEKFFAVVFTGLQYLGLAVTLPIAFVWGVATFLPQFALFRICKCLNETAWLNYATVALFAFAWPALLLLIWKFEKLSNVPKGLLLVVSPAATAAKAWEGRADEVRKRQNVAEKFKR